MWNVKYIKKNTEHVAKKIAGTLDAVVIFSRFVLCPHADGLTVYCLLGRENWAEKDVLLEPSAEHANDTKTKHYPAFVTYYS